MDVPDSETASPQAVATSQTSRLRRVLTDRARVSLLPRNVLTGPKAHVGQQNDDDVDASSGGAGSARRVVVLRLLI
jgi:hypothetical protein